MRAGTSSKYTNINRGKDGLVETGSALNTSTVIGPGGASSSWGALQQAELEAALVQDHPAQGRQGTQGMLLVTLNELLALCVLPCARVVS